MGGDQILSHKIGGQGLVDTGHLVPYFTIFDASGHRPQSALQARSLEVHRLWQISSIRC